MTLHIPVSELHKVGSSSLSLEAVQIKFWALQKLTEIENSGSTGSIKNPKVATEVEMLRGIILSIGTHQGDDENLKEVFLKNNLPLSRGIPEALRKRKTKKGDITHMSLAETTKLHFQRVGRFGVSKDKVNAFYPR